MKPNENTNWLDDALKKTIGADECKPHFDKWRARFPDAVKMLTSRAGAKTSASPLGIRSIKIMRTPLAKLAVAAAIIIAVILTTTLLDKTTSTTYAAQQLLIEAAQAVSNLKSVYIKAQMRTRPGENFSHIGLNYDFVPIEMWKRMDANNHMQWRVEKSNRILLMDGQNTTMLIRPNHGVLTKKPLPLGCFDSWSGRLLNVHDLLDNELQKAKNNPDRAVFLRHENIEGQDKIILEVEVTADIPEDDYLRNKFIQESDHLKVYSFDAKTKLLESLQVYLHTKDEDVLIFEITHIEYNREFDNSIFTLDLPENMNWYGEPQKLPDNEKYEKMTPKEAATAFFQACADENWEEVLKFWGTSRIDNRIKAYLGGLEIISLGEPFKSGGYARDDLGWFVPYEIRFKSGEVKKMNLAIRKDNPANRFVVDGGL